MSGKPGRRRTVTDEQIAELRRLAALGLSVAEIAEQVQVSKAAVYYHMPGVAVMGHRSQGRLKRQEDDPEVQRIVADLLSKWRAEGHR
ncbi:helix-turn-helix domain-containing protein [Anaeromyxobacter sp. PSR-1]|uniref:helix-turn-helix domain-containing protein n=1 Tax=Anaeromyxobacter sp. PSR-1 TaxID=1300915 RepID=UPI0005EA1DD5|nr:helix-turn-helix domain-containing protein [Anaeromyxobacter sp. PSR-1]GAO01938.1 helix-turn-helix domain of resolvase [Anaeromyxobacter sp. PSR-1]